MEINREHIVSLSKGVRSGLVDRAETVALLGLMASFISVISSNPPSVVAKLQPPNITAVRVLSLLLNNFPISPQNLQ